MGRGSVNVPGKFGYDLNVLQGRIEDVAASGLKLGSAEAAQKMLEGTFDWEKDSATATILAAGAKRIGS